MTRLCANLLRGCLFFSREVIRSRRTPSQNIFVVKRVECKGPSKGKRIKTRQANHLLEVSSLTV